MSNYKAEWETAKNTFENSTGVKKPAPTKKNLFGKTVREKVGIGSAFEKVDQLMPTDAGLLIKPKDLVELGKLVSAANRQVIDYVEMLTKAIDAEKTEHGKAADSIYRDLKILKAALQASTADMKATLDKVYVNRQLAADGINGKAARYIADFRTMKSAIDNNGKAALVFVQDLLKDPTAERYNKGIETIARNLTQNLGQIHKFTLPDELGEKALRTRAEAMEDPSVAKAVMELEKKVAHFKLETIPLMKLAGTTPMDATLSRYANNPPKFLGEKPPPKEDVIAAAKNFGAQVKKALELGRKMI